MTIERARHHLLPGEGDPGLREAIARLGADGLRMLGVLELASAVLLCVGQVAVGEPRWTQMVMIAGVGLLTLGVARILHGRGPRLLAALSVWLASVLLMLPKEPHGADDYTIAAITMLLVTAVATVPFLPWHALALGLAVEGTYLLAALWTYPGIPEHREAHHVFLFLLVFLVTGIAASNHARRRHELEAQQEAVRVAEALTGAQLRAELAESAIAIGKMAAALSHEINSPIGALRSSVETLLSVTDRELEAPPEHRQRLAATRAELRRSIDESAARIDDVTRRLRRFVNLEEAEVKLADINELLTDVTVLHDQEIRQARVELDFDLEKSLPPLTCRPQLLTAAFSTILSNAIHAVNGDGRIAIRTRGRGDQVEITVRDNGRGMTPEEADTIFDPGFKVAGGRVASANWSLFNSRQIVYEHGGEISLETAPGQGTTMRVTLPVV